MPLHVVHAEEGLVPGERQRLGGVHPHQQRGRQTGAFGNGDSVHLWPVELRPPHRLFEHGHNRDDVLAGGKLRHDPAVLLVEGDLGGDYVGEYVPAVAH